MNPFLRFVFVLILLFATYHLIRDALQLFAANSVLANAFHWQHQWCGVYCDYIAFPFEIAAMFGAWIVLQRRRIGVIGILTLSFPPLILLGTLLP